MEGLKGEILAFVLAVIAGMIVRLFYQILNCFRKIVKHNLLAMEIEDFFFWVISAVFLFVQIYHTSNGVLRWFVILGIVFGATITTFFLLKVEKKSKKNCKNDAVKNIAKK